MISGFFVEQLPENNTEYRCSLQLQTFIAAKHTDIPVLRFAPSRFFRGTFSDSPCARVC